MTSSRYRRAWSIDSVLYRYFQLRDVGGPSTTMNPENATPCSRRERRIPEVPKWLMRLCDVGCALKKMPPHLRIAIEKRWKAVIALEKAERDVAVQDAKVCRVQREGGDWRAEQRILEAYEDESHELFKVKMRRQRRKAYGEGMDQLAKMLESVP